jgi:GNAT superfamily N-acetyltransferase
MENTFDTTLVFDQFGSGKSKNTSQRPTMVVSPPWRATGNGTFFLGWLAEAYRDLGQSAEGLATLAEALARVEKTGERFYEAELYRLKGELTLQKEARGWRLEPSVSSQ